MEILRKTAIGFWLLASGLLFSFSGFAQANAKAVEDAFESSYSLQEKANYTGAISALKGVYDENSYEVNLRLGWVCYLGGLFTESTAYYQKAMKLKPYSIEAKFGFAFPAATIGNWEQVIAQYNDILKIDPQNTLANYRMGSIYYGKKDFTTAEKYLEKVVNLYPFDYDSNILFAWTNFKLGKTREAQILFHKVLLIRPKDSSAMEGLGMIK